MGEFWYDIERAAQVPHGVCPILAVNSCLLIALLYVLFIFTLGALRCTSPLYGF